MIGPLAVQVGDVVYVPATFVDEPVIPGSALAMDLRTNTMPQCFPLAGDVSAAPYYKAVEIKFSELGFTPPFRLE